ncbi:hypothetical protein [Chondrinema litorale]|uniref:hypothetical protein n=1 Tax=Chondrinema litorale TaxID=2994555 RepID=UPI0025435DB0|nr:hypothetical protein [Chondrinema litorale]UZR94189.1 hypothetical protein OQ292_20330 [Chondrinema litorale]
MKTITNKGSFNLKLSASSKSEDIFVWDTLFRNIQSDKSVLKTLSGYGYNKRKIQQGVDLLKKLKENRRLYQLNKSIELSVTDSLYSKKDELDKIYTNHKNLLREVFKKDNSILKTFKIDAKEETKFVYWFGDVKQFYKQLKESKSVLNKLYLIGLEQREIEIADQLVNNLAQLEEQLSLIAKEENACFQNNAKYHIEFAKWTDSFRTMTASVFKKKLAVQMTPDIKRI